MMVFQYSTNPAHHCQLLECLMTLKQNILKDILCVIAFGTSTARSSAAKLLFYYWPTFNANLFDRKNLICKFAGNYDNFLIRCIINTLWNTTPDRTVTKRGSCLQRPGQKFMPDWEKFNYVYLGFLPFYMTLITAFLFPVLIVEAI